MKSTESDGIELRYVFIDLRRLISPASLARSQMGLLGLVLVLLATNVMGQGTGFTYQGRLTDGGSPANGQYDFQFKLYDTAPVGTGTQQGSTVSVSNVTVTTGVFTVQLDFGTNAFPGADRFLEISVTSSGSGTFVTLSPRQQLRSSPYAIRSAGAASADTATNATHLNAVAADQYVITTDSRLSDARSPTAATLRTRKSSSQRKIQSRN